MDNVPRLSFLRYLSKKTMHLNAAIQSLYATWLMLHEFRDL